MSIIPATYENWEHCITVRCGISLTAEYVTKRIEALKDMNDYHTHRFIERWGEAHHERILAWFREAEERLSK